MQPGAPMMSPRWVTALIAAGVLILTRLGLLDDLIRLGMRQAAAAAAILIWYGPVRRTWKGRGRSSDEGLHNGR